MRAVNRGNGGKTALHRRVRILAVATAVVVPIALSGCGSDSSQVTAGSSGGTQRGAEPGYLVPTDWYTVAGKGPYEVKASVKDGTFTATATGPTNEISYSAGLFTPDSGEVPARCGTGGEDSNPDVPFSETFPEAKADGDVATLKHQLGKGAELSVSQTNPALKEVHPDAFSTLAAGTVAQTAFVAEDDLSGLLSAPDKTVELERWQAQTESGLALSASLSGSVNDGFAVKIIASEGGKEIGRDATPLLGVPCNRRSVMEYDLADRTVYLMLVSDGATATVDGKGPAQVLADDPALLGSWVAVEVPRGDKTVEVTVESSKDREQLTKDTYAFSPPSETGAGN